VKKDRRGKYKFVEVNQMGKILLILPCNKFAKEGNYKKGANWRLVLKHTKHLRERGLLDLCAVDCINMLGLVHERENWKTKGEDVYPSWEHFKRNPLIVLELKEAIKSKLPLLAKDYDHIVAYLNIKGYYLALKEASIETNIPIKFIDLNFNPISYRKHIWDLLILLNTLSKANPLSYDISGRAILATLHGRALNSMEVCRAINGFKIDSFDECYSTERIRKFGYETHLERCDYQERGCKVWSLTVYQALRKLERKGKVRSLKMKWFDKRQGGSNEIKLDLFRFWFREKKDLANRLIRDIETYFYKDA